MITGFPWVWMFLYLAELLLPEYQPAVEQQLFWVQFFVSVLINSLICYYIGRFIDSVVARRKVNLSSNGAT